MSGVLFHDGSVPVQCIDCDETTLAHNFDILYKQLSDRYDVQLAWSYDPGTFSLIHLPGPATALEYLPSLLLALKVLYQASVRIESRFYMYSPREEYYSDEYDLLVYIDINEDYYKIDCAVITFERDIKLSKFKLTFEDLEDREFLDYGTLNEDRYIKC